MNRLRFYHILLFTSLFTGYAVAQNPDFTSDKTGVCAGGVVRFSDNSTEAVSWEWSFGEGAIPATANDSGPHDVVYSTSGFKTISLTINGALTENKENYLQVFDLSAGGTIAVNNSSVCEDESTGSMELSNFTGSIIKWQKQHNSGSWVDITNSSPLHSETLHSPGTWKFRVVVKNGECDEAFSTEANIIVNRIPSGNSITESNICSGVPFNFNLQENINNSVAATFNWTASYPAGLNGGDPVGSGNISGSLTNLTASVLSAVYTVTPTSKAGGCLGETFSITVPISPAPVSIASPSVQSVCTNTSIRLIELINTNGVSGTSYSWVRNKTGVITGIPSNGTGNISGILHNNTSSPESITITITPQGESGCAGAAFFATVLVNPAPEVSFEIKPTFNIDEEPFTLAGNPAGGIFSGPGVVSYENRFYPSIAGLGGPYHIKYSFTDVNGCNAFASHSVIVQQADRIIVGFNADGIHCYEEGNISIRVEAEGAPGIFSGNGISDNGNNTAFFNTIEAGSGRHTVKYSYSAQGSDYNIERVIFVDSIGVVDFINLPDGSEFCMNDSPVELIATPLGGVFSATSGLANNTITPAFALTGLNNVRYTYTSQFGCSKQAMRSIFINEIPNVDFSVTNQCILLSDPDSISFINLTTTEIDPVESWKWNFGNNLATEEENNSELFAPRHLYRTSGLRNVRLTAITDKGCSSVTTKQIDIGDRPRTNFTWDNECYSAGNVVNFFETSQSNTPVSSYNWTFYNKDGPEVLSTSASRNTQFLFPELAYYDVELVLITQLNCVDTLRKTIYLRPTIQLKESNFEEDFKEGAFGWVPMRAQGTNVNSWKFGSTADTPFSNSANNSNAWYTEIADIKAVEQSWITSPCFDFREVKRPMLKLDLWRYFERNRDGGIIQYSTDNSITWQNIGTLGDGINWYNSFQIAGAPGGQPVGWTASVNGIPDNGWKEAYHDVDILVGEPNVRFRIAYGSNGTGLNNQGFAFNSINISERSRLVLLEHFTNTSGASNTIADNIIENVVNIKPYDVSVINYHTGFPGTDPMNKHNLADPAARALFYGISNTPYSVMDGGLEGKGRYDYFLSDFNDLDLSFRSFTDPGFKLKINQNIIDGNANVKVDIYALSNFANSEMTLHVVVIEEEIAASLVGLPGEIVFRNVVKKLLPDASGTLLTSNWNVNDSANYTFEWNMENVFNNEKIGIVAFIQDEKTKEIYQTASNFTYTHPIGTGPGIPAMNEERVNVFPNPASDHLFFRFDDALTRSCKLEIYSFTGSLLISEIIREGNNLYYLDTGVLNTGVYFYKIKNDKNIIGSGRIVIMK